MDAWHLIGKAATLQRGAALFVLAWLLVQVLARIPSLAAPLQRLLRAVTPVLPWWVLVCALLYALAYLAYPTHADHVEASVLVLGEHVRRGLPLYPTDLGYTMDGLLYGPLLAVLNALTLSLPIDAFLGSKLLALASTVAGVALCATQVRDRRALLFLGFLGAFDLLFFNRAEPHLLLLTALACRCMGMSDAGRRAWLLGLLAGLTASLKVHGVLYIAAVYLWAQPDGLRRPALLLRVAAGALVTALPWFLLPGISLPGYLHFLKLASLHGIEPRILLDNGIFLLALWLPLLVLRCPWRSVLGIAALELLVAVLGAKKGAGCWHLLPFVVLHAHMLDALLSQRSPANSHPRAELMALLPMLSLAMSTAFALAPGIRHHLQQRDDIAQARVALRELASSHPGLVLATGAEQGYELSYLRIDLEQLGVRQIDVPAFIDLQWAGVQDAPLAEALSQCRIPHLAVPRGEPAFANLSGYSGRPLFSDAVRLAFAARFVRVVQTAHFDLYRCQAPT
ncbi:hypothetical protein [uncultured Aquabacterium sp.]|uniref:hypothetical protein n=1 Tax=uncultured Aquabacterium sp. TaxID=158753 RepID=UPI0030D1F517